MRCLRMTQHQPVRILAIHRGHMYAKELDTDISGVVAGNLGVIR